MSSPSSASYVMGHTDHERRRLSLQASQLNPLTQDFLVRAGLAPGMRVLDLGCGVGEVTLIAARLVGDTGHVTALDIDPDALDIARARAVEAGLTQVSFEHASIADHHPAIPYDAIIGRLILVHTPDPVAVLRQCLADLRPGGVLAFQEFDLAHFLPANPPKPLWQSLCQLMDDLFSHVGRADIGIQIFHRFRELGLMNIQTRGEFMVNGGPDCSYPEWVAETVRSLLPKFEALHLATAQQLDVDTLAARLKEESDRIGGSYASPILVGTFGTKPAL